MAVSIPNLSTFTDAESGFAGAYSELPAPHSSGAAPAVDTENYIQGVQSASQATGQATGTGAGFQYVDTGTPISLTAGQVVLAWTFYAAPTNLETWANGGARLGIGTEDNLFLYNIMGSNFGNYPYGGWQCTAVDPSLTQDAAVGTPSGTTHTAVCFLPNILTKITKGTPQVMDVIRFGTAEIQVTGTETFDSIATANDASTARWGMFQASSAGFNWKGKLTLGTAATALSMTSSNRAITLEDTPRVIAGFNKIEVNNNATSLTWSSISISGVETSITGSAPVSQGDYEEIDSPTVSMDSCTFTDLGTFSFNTATNPSTLTSCTFRRCGTISPNGATITGGTLAVRNGGVGISIATPAEITNVSGMTIQPASTTDTGSVAIQYSGTTDITLTGHTFSGLDGTNSRYAFEYTGGGTVNITPSAGCNITQAMVLNTSGTATVVAPALTLDITNLRAGSEVRIFRQSDLVEVGTGIETVSVTDGTFSDGSTKYKATFTHSQGGTAVYVVVHALGYVNARIDYTLPTTDGQSLLVSQVLDRVYSNPV